VLCATHAHVSLVAAQTTPQTSEEFSIKLKGVDGKIYDAAKMKGEVVVVSFGATWCRPCVAEIEALEALKREYSGRPLKIWWASIESEDEKSDVLLREYAKDLRMTIPVLRDPERIAYGRFSQKLRMPLVVFFDRNGRYVAPIHVGMSTPDVYQARMRERIDPLLK
ncbi:MAG: TlpA disulfide reductase family protein, partial [Pyrinomonadaceae bacterium]